MKQKDVLALIIVSALWGGSFLLMRIIVPTLGAVVLAESRVLIAGIILMILAFSMRLKLEWRKYWWQYTVIGLLNGALPFTLIAAAEIHLTASVAVILNATTPLFGAIFAMLCKIEIISQYKMIGLLLGFAGIGVLVGWNPLETSTTSSWAVLASLVAAAGYGAVNVYTKIKVHSISPIALAAGSQLTAAIMLLPLIPLVPIISSPSPLVIVYTIILAVFCTAVARVLHFRLILNIGPTKAALTTYLAPCFGIAWGWAFLAETPNTRMLIGLILILSSVVLILKSPVRLSA